MAIQSGPSHASLARHGGQLRAARSLYPEAQQPWIDVSTGINPSPYRAPRASKDLRRRLPDVESLRQLEATAGAAFGVIDPARVAAVAGSECALRLLPHLLALRNALVVEPTYASHADAWLHAGVATDTARVEDVPSTCSAATAIVVVNPNNPDGRLMSRSCLQHLHDCAARSGGVLIVDEAFADTTPDVSVADIAGCEGAERLIVLRSFGKFFGLAGVRLGFVIAAPTIAESVRRCLGDWPVSVDAIVAGQSAYSDSDWIDRTRARLRREALRMDRLLLQTGFAVRGGTSLFRLTYVADAEQRFRRMLSQGVLVRPFRHDATLLRFGLPAPRHWARFACTLGECAKG